MVRVSQLSPQNVSQGGSYHGETPADISEDPLSSKVCLQGAPLTLPLVHLPAGKGNCISEQLRPCSGRSLTSPHGGRCFLLAHAHSAYRAPVTSKIPWLSSWLMSFLPANSHVGPCSRFSSACFPFHLHREKKGSEMTPITLLMLMDL